MYQNRVILEHSQNEGVSYSGFGMGILKHFEDNQSKAMYDICARKSPIIRESRSDTENKHISKICDTNGKGRGPRQIRVSKRMEYLKIVPIDQGKELVKIQFT